MKMWQLPLRLATGAFMLDQGLSKRGTDADKASRLQGMASTALPQAKSIDAMSFVNLLSAGETALGSSLLIPLIPSWVGGLGLIAFASGLLRMYLRAPGLRQDGSLRPTPNGIGLAKDSWLLAIGIALVLGSRGD